MRKALIIDDTRLARKDLRFLLQSQEGIEIIGEATNADEAQTMIEQLEPDLLFLDIQMPGKNGFELLESLDEVPTVIFVTAYNEFAIKAFEYNALDYLQKPVKEDRLRQAIDKLNHIGVSDTTTKRSPKKMLTESSRVFVKDGDRCWFVPLKDIRLFEVEDNYTRIYFENDRPMILKTLNYLETRLDPEVFFRANRQQIINTKWIDRVEPWFSATIRLFLKDGTEIQVSRRQSSRFKELMGF